MQKIRDRRKPWENAKQRKKRRRRGGLTEANIIKGIMDGTIASAVSDSGATSTAGKPSDPFNETGERSTKVFGLPTGGTAAASAKAKLKLNLREPANNVDIVP